MAMSYGVVQIATSQGVVEMVGNDGLQAGDAEPSTTAGYSTEREGMIKTKFISYNVYSFS